MKNKIGNSHIGDVNDKSEQKPHVWAAQRFRTQRQAPSARAAKQAARKVFALLLAAMMILTAFAPPRSVLAAAEVISVGKPVYCSSQDSPDGITNLPARNVNDGSVTTRWANDREGKYGPPDTTPWITIGLTVNCSVSAVEILWETARAQTFDIQVSSDNVNFTTIKSGTSADYQQTGSAYRVQYEFTNIEARYVRISCLTPETAWGYSIWELTIYGTSLENTTASLSSLYTFDTGGGNSFMSVNLTDNGSLDWFQLSQNSETNYSKKLNGSGLYGFRRDATAVPNPTSGALGTINDGRITYTATDRDPASPPIVDRYGLTIRGVGNYLEFKVASSALPRLLKVYTGNWSAASRADFIVGGTVLYSANTANQAHNAVYCVTVYVEPGQEGTFRLTLTNMTGYGASNGSAFIFAAALGDSFTIDRSNMSLRVGASDKITSFPAEGVTWSSSDATVASVDQSGNVTGNKVGDAVITAEFNGSTKTCAVRVVSATAEIVAGGYVIDMQDLPKVHFANHPEWEEVYDATWQIHKSNIMKIPAATNPEEPYFVDAAFSGAIYAWDTLFMMMFDKWGMNQFPTLTSLDNFYYHQIDKPGQEDDGYIPREITRATGIDVWAPDGALRGIGYQDSRSMNPPLWAWAEWDQYMIHGDTSRFSKIINGKTIYERLVAHFDFIERYKKIASGLYGKTNGYGNGLDNTWNQGSPYDGGNAASDGGQTYNDLSIQQAQFAYYLAKIAGAMGNAADQAKFESEHARISALIREKMWDEGAKMFSNLDRDGVTRTNVSTPTTLWALAGHVATPQQAADLVKYHGHNSNKLFRPFGLATADYTDPRHLYSPEGAYWRGSYWAPTSFQYIKGLSECGFDDLAFEEALRHLSSVTAIYGSTRTVWENYSSDFETRGSQSKDNFAGWTGCLSIGVILDDILGLKMDAPNNTINWNIRLSEEHGVSNLWLKHNGAVNRVSLLAKDRKSAKDPVTFTVNAERPFILKVTNNGATQTFNIPAGTSEHTMGGISGNSPRLEAYAYQYSGEGLSAATLAGAEDYVTFGSSIDASVIDGLGYQIRKGAGLIKNVNTIGESPLTVVPVYRDNAQLQALGVAGAREVTRGTSSKGKQGFMFEVPADNTARTVTVILGITGGNAEVRADLMDASARPISLVLTGGTGETVYAVDIPYRGGRDGHNLLVRILHTATSGSAVIALKGMILSEGAMPAAPINATATPHNSAVTLNAQAPTGDSFDSWKIYYGTSRDNLDITVVANAFPFTVGGLTNMTRYYFALSGVTGGVESMRTGVLSAIPEENPLSDAERALVDLEAALASSGLGEGSKLKQPFTAPVSVGPFYESVISWTSDTNGQRPGLWNTGEIEMPIGKDKATAITVTSKYNDATVSRVVNVVLPAADFVGGAYVLDTTASIFTGSVYLTNEGTKDWIQMTQAANGVNPQARKAGGSGFGIPRLAFPSSDHKRASGLGLSYVYTASDAAQTSPGITNDYAVDMRGRGDYIEIDVSYSEKPQRAYVYFGMWHAEIRVDFIVNGLVAASETASSTGNSVVNYRVGFDFKLSSPEDKASIRVILSNDNDFGSANFGSLVLNALTLAEFDKAPHNITAASGAQVPAEQFAHKNLGNDPNIENSSPSGKNVGGLGAGSWLTYNLNVETAGQYSLTLEYAAQSATNPGLTILLDDVQIGAITSITATGGWQNWALRTIEVILPSGSHELRLNYANSGTNLKSIGFSLLKSGFFATLSNTQISGDALKTIEASIYLENYQEKEQSCTLVLALYDAAGRMVAVVMKPTSVAALRTATVTIALDQIALGAGYTLNAMVWDDLYVPLVGAMRKLLDQ